MPLGNRNARLGFTPSAPLNPADWNVPAVLSRYQLSLDEGAVPGLAAPAGRRALRVGRETRWEGGRAIEGGGRWAGAPGTRRCALQQRRRTAEGAAVASAERAGVGLAAGS